MRFAIHPELGQVIAAAAEFAARFQRRAIEPADLLLALHGASNLAVGQKLALYELSVQQLQEEGLTAEATLPAAEQPEFGQATLALFSQAVDPATFFGRTQISAADLAAVMICEHAVIKMLVRAGLNPQNYAKLQDELMALVKIQRDGATDEAQQTAVQRTVH